VRVPAAVGACGILLGAAYALAVAADGGPLDRGAPLAGAMLLLVCELGYWSHELRTTSPDEPGARARHVAWLSLLVLGTSCAGVVLVVVSELAKLEGVAIDVVGGVAAIAAFALLAHLATSGGFSAGRMRGAHTEAERPEEAPWRGA
jgi:hypothetical protein